MFNILRWLLLAIVIVLGLGVLYRVAVEQPKQARLGVVTPGTLVAGGERALHERFDL